MKRDWPTNRVKAEQGATLIITMIFLIIMTYLGLSTIQETALEEKMASNLRQSNLVLQAAEDALLEGEFVLNGTPVLPDFDNTAGYFDQDYDVDGFIHSASWAVSSTSCSGWVDCTYDSSVRIKRGYVIQEMPATGLSDSLETGVAQDNDKFYRVTAKAEGNTTSAVAVLQTIYRR